MLSPQALDSPQLQAAKPLQLIAFVWTETLQVLNFTVISGGFIAPLKPAADLNSVMQHGAFRV